eukprot:322936-Hanusia_phi.AAC.1
MTDALIKIASSKTARATALRPISNQGIIPLAMPNSLIVLGHHQGRGPRNQPRSLSRHMQVDVPDALAPMAEAEQQGWSCSKEQGSGSKVCGQRAGPYSHGGSEAEASSPVVGYRELPQLLGGGEGKTEQEAAAGQLAACSCSEQERADCATLGEGQVHGRWGEREKDETLSRLDDRIDRARRELDGGADRNQPGGRKVREEGEWQDRRRDESRRWEQWDGNDQTTRRGNSMEKGGWVDSEDDLESEGTEQGERGA